MAQAQDDELLARVRATLGDELFERAIGYTMADALRAGGVLQIGATRIESEPAAALVFVDLEPALNWSHRACYLVVPAAPLPLRRIEATQPPFLKADGPPCRPLWRGSLAPEWAVVTPAT